LALRLTRVARKMRLPWMKLKMLHYLKS